MRKYFTLLHAQFHSSNQLKSATFLPQEKCPSSVPDGKWLSTCPCGWPPEQGILNMITSWYHIYIYIVLRSHQVLRDNNNLTGHQSRSLKTGENFCFVW